MAATAENVGGLAFPFTIGAAIFAPVLGRAMATRMSTLVFGFHGGHSSFQLDRAGRSLFREIVTFDSGAANRGCRRLLGGALVFHAVPAESRLRAGLPNVT